jgi:hypothetical protein
MAGFTCQDQLMVDGSQVPTEILGLPLPEALRRVITAGLWKAPPAAVIAEVFGDDPEKAVFYDPQTIERETRNLRDDPHDVMDMFHGTSPHDIDPQRTLFIGDPYYDAPFALDYLYDIALPRVVYFNVARRLFKEGGDEFAWKEIAPDIETLIERLGIGGPPTVPL